MASLFKLFGYTTTFDFITAGTGLKLISWKPTLPGYKEGGLFADSKITPGRRPVHRQEANDIDTIKFGLYGASPDAVSTLLQNLLFECDRAFDYWLPDSTDLLPIYMQGTIGSETNTRYAWVYKAEITGEFPDLYHTEFQTGILVDGYVYACGISNLTLTIERSKFMSNAPGNSSNVSLTTFEDDRVYNAHVPGTYSAKVRIGSSSVLGDLPAIGKLTLSDMNGTPGDTPNSFLCGLRSVDRGSNFTAYLNFSDPSPSEYSPTVGGVATTVVDTSSPTGEAMQVNIVGLGSTLYTELANIALDDTDQFRGRFRAFLRVRMITTALPFIAVLSVDAAVDTAGNGGSWAKKVYVPAVGAAQVVIIDFGEVVIPLDRSFVLSSDANICNIRFYVKPESTTTFQMNFQALTLLPVDQYAFEAFFSGGVPNDGGVIVDSISVPRNSVQVINILDFSPVESSNSTGTSFISTDSRLAIPPKEQLDMWFFFYEKISDGNVNDATDSSVLVDLDVTRRYNLLRGSS